MHNSPGNIELEDADSGAIDALMALGTAAAPRKKAPSTMTHIFNQVTNFDTDDEDEIEDEDEEDELEEGEEDQLQDELNDNSTPQKSRPEFAIPFEFPFNGVTRDLTSITLTMTFNEFCLKLAKKMETQLSLLLHIGYIPSYKPKNP
ncbi:hypothetical protein L208DRAFT_1380935 [Tricholoma matsutake]|nr:hypothetical protein L208DRAFT_1380935 [Tricholoma matsutake 945]